MGVRLICLAWAALCLRCPYGRGLNMFVMGRPVFAGSVWACAQYVWHVPPYGCRIPMGVLLICLAWALYGCCLPMAVRLICLAWAALWRRHPYGRALNMFGVGRPMAAVSLWACA